MAEAVIVLDAAFVVGKTDPREVGINLRGFEFSEFLESRVMKADDLNATNTADNPERVRAEDGPAATVRDGVWHVTVPPASWSVFRFGCGPTGIPAA
jgi:alpha-N-arabinofuranosidase